jgi:hypothetical protein
MTWRVRFIFATTTLALMLFVNVCVARGQQRALTAEETQVVATVSAIFNAATQDDLAKFHAVTAPGFYIFDAGSRFDGDAIMTLIKAEHAKGRRYEWNVTEPDVHLSGDTAWIAYVNKGSVSDASATTPQRWLESAFLQREAGSWKIVFMHSTRVPQVPPPAVALKR